MRPSHRFGSLSVMVTVALLVVSIFSILGATKSLSMSSFESSSGGAGPVLGVPGLSHWAVVGDVTNKAKPAFAVAARLQDSGRTVYRVSPYAQKIQEENMYRQLSDIPMDVRIDAVNLIVAPRVGISVLEEMKRRSIQYCFIQPGADTPNILAMAQELDIIVQQGCVLIQPLPPLLD